METFISERIEEATKQSIEKGKTKYRAYFVKTKRYKKWQEDVNSILELDGYADAIVTQ